MRKTSLLLLLLTAAVSGSFAQQNSFLIKKVNLKGVSPDTDFSSIQQDDDGFLWLGGLSGLYRYDGARITRFLRDPADTNSLTHNYANTLTKDRTGNIWIGTFGGFMNRYNRVSGKIERIEPNIKSQPRFVVMKTKVDLNGNVLLIATAQGMFKINLAGNVTDSIIIPAGSDRMDTRITDFLEYENDKFILTTTNGLFFIDWKNKTRRSASFIPAGISFNCVEKDNEGNFWLGADSALLIMTKNFSLADKSGYDSEFSLTNATINCIKKDVTGRMWIGTNTGLFIADQQKITKINTAKIDSLKNINELFIDNKGITWISAAGKGLYQVYQPGRIFQTIPGMQQYANNKMIQSIVEENPGTWLIGTKSGLYRYNFLSTKFEEINLPGEGNKLWIGAQLIDKNKGYWIGTFGQGVFYRSPGTKEFTQFTNQPISNNSLPFNTIMAFAEDPNGNIWMGSFNNGSKSNSLCYYDPHTKHIHGLYSTADPKTFQAIDVSQIETDNQHNVWIGTWDIGLYRYHSLESIPQQNAFTNYTETSAAPLKISQNIVSCIRPGRNGKIWFGTISGGLNVLDTKTNTNNWYTIKDGLPSNLIYRIEEDEQGILWLSTDNGIARFDPVTKSFTNYNTISGLPTNNFAFLASIKCADGTIAFGTNDGQVVYFNPNSSKNLKNTQAVVITDIRLFNKSLEPGSASLLKKASYLTDTLRLRYDHSVISFELANMDFLYPETYTYAYKLEGFDKDWTYISDKNSITYTNLDPGTYTLLVKNADHYGTWNETPTKLLLIITPPFWLTWWFISLLFLTVTSIVYALFRYRLYQKLRVLQVRNRLHRDLHDDVGATLSSIKAYSEILKDNPDNPLIAGLIKDNSTEMLDKLEVIAWATNPQHDHFKSLKNLMVKFAIPLCHSKNIQCIIDSAGVNEEMLMPGEVRQNIFLVFKESVNNMIKYAEATECSIHLFIRGNQFVLKIADNGKGFDGTTKGTGSGWKNMQKRTEDLNGRLVINSAPGKGTVITMSLSHPFKIPSSWDREKV